MKNVLRALSFIGLLLNLSNVNGDVVEMNEDKKDVTTSYSTTNQETVVESSPSTNKLRSSDIVEEIPPTVSNNAENTEAVPASSSPNKETNPPSPSTGTEAPRESYLTLTKDPRQLVLETAKSVSLTPADTKSDPLKGKLSVVAYLSLNFRKKICMAVLGLVSITNAAFENYIFDVHLYEFEFPNGESKLFIAIQCPTKSYPQIFVRVPTSSGDLKVVVVPAGDRSSQRYSYTLTTAAAMTPPVPEDNEAVKELRKSPIFDFTSEKLWDLCEAAKKRFKYGLLISLKQQPIKMPEPYKVKIGETTGLYGVIECPSTPTIYLLFNNSDQEIKITFLNVISNWIENNIMRFKPNFVGILKS